MPKPFIPIKDKWGTTDWCPTLIKANLFDKLYEQGNHLILSQVSSTGELDGTMYFTPNHYTFQITPNDIIVRQGNGFYARLENNAEILQLLQKYTSMNVKNL